MSIILSIGIPTYNRVGHLRRLMNYFCSELNGELAEKVELIVSNDNSPDNTKEFLNSIIPCPKWLRIINNLQNLGSHGNMSQIIHFARGEYIWLPGDDDYYKKDFIHKVISIIEANYELSFIFVSRLGINERTHEVGKLMKRHDVKYDVSYAVTNKTIVKLLKENFGDLKYQGSTIVKRSIALKCEHEITLYTQDTQDDCYSLFRAFRGLQSGESFFISEVCVLNGNEISWGDKMVQYLFVSDVEFVEGLTNFGISKNDCDRISNRLLGAYYSGLLTNKQFNKKWRELGMPGLRLSALFSTLFLAVRHFLYRIHLSDIYYPINISITDFGIDEGDIYEQ